jgi:two-component system, chemotaxis family, chemotaxis protein CheY
MRQRPQNSNYIEICAIPATKPKVNRPLFRYTEAMPATALVATKTILVADDTAFVRDRFKEALEAAGHRALTAGSSAELVARVRANAPGIDLLVLDLRLPQGRGVDLVRALRKIDQFRAAMVVFSGTIANAGEVRELSALGVAGYVNEYTAAQHIVPSLNPHLFPDGNNRRSSPRAVVAVAVSYRFGNTIAAALTLNVSAGGVAIRTTSMLDSGTVVRVRFRLPGAPKEVEADARVAWTDRRVGMGLEFTSIDRVSQETIDRYVHAHFFTNRKA